MGALMSARACRSSLLDEALADGRLTAAELDRLALVAQDPGAPAHPRFTDPGPVRPPAAACCASSKKPKPPSATAPRRTPGCAVRRPCWTVNRRSTSRHRHRHPSGRSHAGPHRPRACRLMIAWRLCRRPHATLDGEGARRFGGRWNSPGRPVVYLADHPALAAFEVRVHLDLPFELLPSDYVLMRVDVPDPHQASNQAPPPSSQAIHG